MNISVWECGEVVLVEYELAQNGGIPSSSRAIFHHVNHDLAALVTGFSTRWHTMGSGKSLVMSVVENHEIPGSTTLVQIQAGGVSQTRPYLSWENPGA